MTDEVLTNILIPSSTYYDILGVPAGATTRDIKQAYKKLAIMFHPDKYRGAHKEDATEAFRKITDAYETLSDPRLRSDYDATISQRSSRATGSPNRYDPHPDWTEAQRTVHSFYVFIEQVEKDLEDGVENDDVGTGIVVLGSLAAIKEGTSVIAGNPFIGLVLLAAGAIYALVTTADQRAVHQTNLTTALDWSTWDRDTKLNVVKVLKQYYQTQFDGMHG